MGKIDIRSGIKMTVLVFGLVCSIQLTNSQTVAIVQYEVQEPDKVGIDAGRLENFVREAAANGVQLVVCPETVFYRYQPWEQNGVTMLELASQYPDLKSHFAALAKELEISIIIGLREPSGDSAIPVFNTALFIGPNGEVLGKQHKLVPSNKEKAWTKAGNSKTVFETSFGRVGMMICKTAKTKLWNVYKKEDNIDLFILIAGDNDATSFDKFPEICKNLGCHGILGNLVHGPEGSGRKGNSAWGFPDGRVEYLGGGEQIFYNGLPLPTKKTASPLPGQIIHDPHNPSRMVYNRDNDGNSRLDPFFLCGPGDPEGFLYRGKRNPDGTRSGDQLQLIKKLKQHGGNCIYMAAVRTHGGDAPGSAKKEPTVYPDALHNPWIHQDPKNGLNESILNQWEEWFTEMDKNNIIIYFFIYDDAINVAKQFGWALDENGELHPGEKEFVQSLIRRFKHHKNLIWCIMEEGQEIGANWREHISKIAEAIAEADNHQHIIAAHQLGGNVFFHNNDPHISQFALQTDKTKVVENDELHRWLQKAVIHSDGHYSIVMSEDRVHGTLPATEEGRKTARLRNWISAMAGTYPMVLGMDIANTPSGWLNDCRTIQRFFESTTFNQMLPANELAFGETMYVLANQGYDYIAYSAKVSDKLGLKNLDSGSYSLTWLDCATGKQSEQNITLTASNQIREKPPGFGNEIALFVYRKDKRPELATPTLANKKPVWEKNNNVNNTVPVAENEFLQIEKGSTASIQLRYNDSDGGPGPYTIEIIEAPKYGILTGKGNDKFYTANENYMGNDQFTWKVHDGESTSNTAAVVIKIIQKRK